MCVITKRTTSGDPFIMHKFIKANPCGYTTLNYAILANKIKQYKYEREFYRGDNRRKTQQQQKSSAIMTAIHSFVLKISRNYAGDHLFQMEAVFLYICLFSFNKFVYANNCPSDVE